VHWVRVGFKKESSEGRLRVKNGSEKKNVIDYYYYYYFNIKKIYINTRRKLCVDNYYKI